MNNYGLPIIVMENSYNNLQALKLTEEPFKDIMYIYGKVSFDEGEETPRLRFEYEVIENAGKTYDVKEFEAYIGKILEELIHHQVKDNSLVYTGGVDENRTKDFNESDT